MKNILVILIALLSLTSCLPAIFTAASATTIATAKDRTFGNTVDDITISARIRKDFVSKGFKKLYTKITVEVVESRVLLTGEVESEEDIISAVDIAWSAYGVKEVINELKVSEESNKFDTAQYAKDTWITGRIKASTFFKRDIKFVNYTVVTMRNIVYLFGIARTEDELGMVTDIASSVAGVEKVVSYVRLKEESAPKIDDQSDILESKDKLIDDPKS